MTRPLASITLVVAVSYGARVLSIGHAAATFLAMGSTTAATLVSDLTRLPAAIPAAVRAPALDPVLIWIDHCTTRCAMVIGSVTASGHALHALASAGLTLLGAR